MLLFINIVKHNTMFYKVIFQYDATTSSLPVLRNKLYTLEIRIIRIPNLHRYLFKKNLIQLRMAVCKANLF